VWNEPALFRKGDQLFLGAVCLSWDVHTGEPRLDQSRVAVFATAAAGDADEVEWRYVGTLAGPEEAAELGGDNLVQVDLVRSRDGQLLLVATPNTVDEATGLDVHHGCRVVEVESLDPPRLRRDWEGALRVRAVITASDLEEFGPGSCAYDPASSTGVVLTRRELDFDAGEMVVSLHATGVAP
jgi:hypothetical protein